MHRRPRPRGPAPACLLPILLWFPGAGRAQEIIVQANQELEVWHDTDLDETVADERLDGYLGYGGFSLQSTFLIHHPTNAGRLDPNSFGDPFEGVRKRMLQARVGPAVAQLGNVYSTLARGVALQVIEDLTVDFDNGVDGLRMLWDAPRLRAELLAGRNAYGDAQTYLKAASLGMPAAIGGWTSAVHGVQVDSTADAAGRPRGRDRVFGGELGWQSSWADVFSTYMIRDHNPPEGRRRIPQGHAAYGVLNVYAGPLSVSFSAMDYLRYTWAYSQGAPVTVRQHATTLLTRASHVANFNRDDERGYLAQALLGLRDGSLNFTLSRSASETHGERLPYFENYGDIQWYATDDLIFTLRAGETEETLDKVTHEAFTERITWGGNLFWSFGGLWSIEIDLETQERQEQNLSTAAYTFPLQARDNMIVFNVYRAPSLSFAVTYEWTDDSGESKMNWTFVEGNVQFLDHHRINVGLGDFRGGQLCSGGICRPVAPFSGLRFNWQTTF